MKSITSRDNPLYKEWLALATDRRARRHSGRTLLDGPHLLQAASEAGVTIQRLIFSESAAVGPLAAWCERLPAALACVLPNALFNALTPVETPTGVIGVIDMGAVFNIGEDSNSPRAVPADYVAIVLLENVQDPGNLGAILRVVAAAGFAAVYLSSGCCDVWSPKCLRGGQGAHFQVALHENADLLAVVRDFAGPVYAASLAAHEALFDLDLRGAVGFAFGNEGAGLSAALCAAATPFIIPMQGKVESLNVATAAAVCLFERLRQGRGRQG